MNKILTTALFLAAGTALSNAAALLVEWDFSSASTSTVDDTTTIRATGGSYSSTTLTLGTNVSLDDGVLSFTGGTGAKADISSLGLDGVSGNSSSSFTISITLTSFASSSTGLLWSAGNNTNNNLTGLMLNSSGSNAYGMWKGSSSNRTLMSVSDYLSALSEGTSLTLNAVFSSSGMSLYINGTLVGTDSGLKWSDSTLDSLCIGAWNSGSTTSQATMSVSSFAIYSGTVVPEPSSFGLLAGLGALAMVASRRRRRSRRAA